jgi:serine/threonine protein phosphatase 1
MSFRFGQALWPTRQARPTVSPKHRVYAVGDLHGRYDLLRAMLERIIDDFEGRRDDRRLQIVFLGDYIDRGDQSRDVLETLMKLVGGVHLDIVALRGNHEAALLDFVRAPNMYRSWLDFGAQQTMASYGVSLPRREMSETDLVSLRDQLVEALGEHLEFLRELPLMARSGDVVFTHAGVGEGDGEALANQQAMLWGDRGADPDWPAPGKLVVHGHYDDVDAVDRPGRICVDTGAYYSGRLTAVRIDDGTEFLTVTNKGAGR